MPFVSDGLLFGSLTDKQKDKVIDKVAALAVQRFEDYRNSIKDAFDFREPNTTFERLALYRARPQEEWQRMQQQFPKEYSQQIKDWAFMENRNAFFRLRRYASDTKSGMPITPTETMV